MYMLYVIMHCRSGCALDFQHSYCHIIEVIKPYTCSTFPQNISPARCTIHVPSTKGIFFFSSPEHKVLRVSYCDRSLSVVRKLFFLNISSETTFTKLHRNDPWVVPYQSCSNCSSWLHK